MNKRTIMIFPEFRNMHVIEGIRKKYDPLCDLVQPHITLVFPFESELSTCDIEDALKQVLAEVSSFSIELRGLTQFEQWIFLNVTRGGDIISKIHESLYCKCFSRFKPSWLKNYMPHLTVGQFPSAFEAQKVYEVEKCQAETFHCVVKKIYVEIIGENEESIIETEYELR